MRKLIFYWTHPEKGELCLPMCLDSVVPDDLTRAVDGLICALERAGWAGDWSEVRVRVGEKE